MPEIKLYKTRERRQTRDTSTMVLINHSVNYLQKGKHYSGKIRLDGNALAYHDFMKLAREEYGYTSYFSHFALETVNGDYIRISGCPIDSRSEWLSSLVDKGYLKAEMRNAILIDISSDLSFDILDQQGKMNLGQMIAQILNAFKLPISNVDLIDNHIQSGNDGSLELKPLKRLKDLNSDVLLYVNKYR